MTQNDGASANQAFHGKITVVAGGSRGIGRIVAHEFARRGARVAVLASSDIDKARSVCDEIAAAGGAAFPYVANIAKPDEIGLLCKRIVDEHERIDILVNSAGAHFSTYVGDTSEAEFDRLCDVNFKGAYFLMNTVAPIMISQQAGKIVNISAQMSSVPFAGMAIYCATKAALDTLTAAMAWELGPHGINCNAVAPGNTLTPEHEGLMQDPAFADVAEWTASVSPSARKVSSASDIANVVMFLASEASNAIYGETIVADEGMTKAWRGYLSNGKAIFPDLQGKRRLIGN